MSLYIGNLSSHTPKDELRHVFLKFGRCRVQMKDGYGFVVYEFPPNADKALRALRGRKIFGEPLFLSWSNKQPKPFQKFTTGESSYGFHHDRVSAGGEHVNRRIGLVNRLGNKVKFNKFGRGEKREGFFRVVNEEKLYGWKRRKISNSGESESNDIRQVSNDPNPIGGGRWGEELQGSIENGVEFERYEPSSQGYDRNDGGFDSMHTFHDDKRDQKPLDNSEDPELVTCYSCGCSGHKRLNCPKEKDSRSSRHDDTEEEDNDMSKRNIAEHSQERDGSKSGKGVSRSSGKTRKTPRSGGPSLEENGSRKRRRKDQTDLENDGSKRGRRLVSYHSRSPSSSPLQSSRSKSSVSLSVSSRTHSSFSNSRSLSPSSVQASPNIDLLNQKDSAEKATSPRSNKKLVGNGQLTQDSIALGSKIPKTTTLATNDEVTGIASLAFSSDGRKNSFSPLLEKVASTGTVIEEKQCKRHDENRVLEDSQRIGSSPSISSEEMEMLLKHYRLDVPEGNERNSAEDSFFGSARLWPWEIIYYRRMKKGPISVENYARRFAQNKEFSIVDKFIRSSSGWGELSEPRTGNT